MHRFRCSERSASASTESESISSSDHGNREDQNRYWPVTQMSKNSGSAKA